MIDTGQVFGRSIGFPPRIGVNGQVAWSEGAQNIRESIQIILLTEAGERLMLGDFGGGLKQFLYEPNTVETRRLIEERIIQALERWEPRIRLDSVSVEADREDPQAAIATIAYKLIATQHSEGVSLKIKLAG